LQQLIGFFNYLLFGHNIAEILLKLALNTNQSINQSYFYFFFTHGQCVYMMVGLWCFTPLNNISVISLLSVLLEETGVPGENPQPIASLYETFSQNYKIGIRCFRYVYSIK
jgi:hypothetical protein